MKKFKSQIKFNIIVILVIVFSFFINSTRAFATGIFFNADSSKIALGQQFNVKVFVDASNENINTVLGAVTFPSDLLEVKNISDGNSIINFWIEKPKITTENRITFSGIIPGGYSASRGLIFSIDFLAKKEGSGIIEFNGIKALQNDGLGTEIPLAISNFPFLISKQTINIEVAIPKIEDRDPPEEFTPQIAADPAIFEDKWFLVFAAQDKGSGIDHYEVSEGSQPFVVAESPYLLHNQDLDEEITVKAVDKNGNERIAILPPQKPSAWYKDYAIIAILMIAVVAYFIWKKRRK